MGPRLPMPCWSLKWRLLRHSHWSHPLLHDPLFPQCSPAKPDLLIALLQAETLCHVRDT